MITETAIYDVYAYKTHKGSFELMAGDTDSVVAGELEDFTGLKRSAFSWSIEPGNIIRVTRA